MLFEQLPLDIVMEPAATLDNFVVGDNGGALTCLRQMKDSFGFGDGLERVGCAGIFSGTSSLCG